MNYQRTPTTTGECEKLAAHALLAARREGFISRGRRALLRRALAYGTATADDVRSKVELPDGIDPVCFGAVPGLLACAGMIEPDGFTKSRRRESHARPIQVWRLVDRAGAVAWLDNHPDRTDSTHPNTKPIVRQTLFDMNETIPPTHTVTATTPRKGN